MHFVNLYICAKFTFNVFQITMISMELMSVDSIIVGTPYMYTIHCMYRMRIYYEKPYLVFIMQSDEKATNLFTMNIWYIDLLIRLNRRREKITVEQGVLNGSIGKFEKKICCLLEWKNINKSIQILCDNFQMQNL